jgi:serine/threonine protein phosphatase PrpC
MKSSVRAAPIAGLAAAGGTNPGRQREQNEDRYHLDAAAGIFLVVDGVGGEAAGEVAAQIAVQTILNRLARQDGLAELRIREAITLANRDILRQACETPERAEAAAFVDGWHQSQVGPTWDKAQKRWKRFIKAKPFWHE